MLSMDNREELEMYKKLELEALRFYLEESDDAQVDTTPMKIEKK